MPQTFEYSPTTSWRYLLEFAEEFVPRGGLRGFQSLPQVYGNIQLLLSKVLLFSRTVNLLRL